MTQTPRPVRIAVLTVSDTRTVENDTSGELLASRITAAGHFLADRRLVRDDPPRIEATLKEWIGDPAVEAVLTTGGTGLTGRDVTADVVERLGDKLIPGFGELFRWLSFEDIGTSTIQSRALGVLAGETLVFALPGSTGACRLAWDRILVHQFDVRLKPCNLVQLMPRFGERE